MKITPFLLLLAFSLQASLARDSAMIPSTLRSLEERGIRIWSIFDTIGQGELESGYIVSLRIYISDPIADDINVSLYEGRYDNPDIMIPLKTDLVDSQHPRQLIDFASTTFRIKRSAISRYSIRFSNRRGSDSETYLLPLSEIRNAAEQGAAANP